MEIEVTVQSQKEFDDAIQRYIESGYELESNTDGTAVLRKKGFKLWIFIVLLLFVIIGAIVYYFLSDDNVVVLKRVSNSNHYYCRECGVSLTDEAKFCPKCGAPINWEDENDVSAQVTDDNAFKI